MYLSLTSSKTREEVLGKKDTFSISLQRVSDTYTPFSESLIMSVKTLNYLDKIAENEHRIPESRTEILKRVLVRKLAKTSAQFVHC